MNLKGKIVLVTGGAGFIGSHVVDRLVKESPRKIIVFSDFSTGTLENIIDSIAYPVVIYQSDLADRVGVLKFFDSCKVDVVFNLAMVNLPTSLEKPEWAVRKNMNSTLNLCEAQKSGTFKTLVQFSSSEAYGTAIFNPMNEDHPNNPTTPYGASKLSTDAIVLSYQKSFGVDTSVIRPFNAFGPRQDSGNAPVLALIPATIKKAFEGGPLYINGNGEQTRDYTYVTDIADAAIKICENEETRGKIINIGSGRNLSVNKIVETIANETSYFGEIIHREERQGEVKKMIADISLAKSLIGYTPSVTFEQGIKPTVAWYKKKWRIET